jgi:hypothetical protein
LPRHLLDVEIFHLRLAFGNNDGVIVATRIILRKSREGMKKERRHQENDGTSRPVQHCGDLALPKTVSRKQLANIV